MQEEPDFTDEAVDLYELLQVTRVQEDKIGHIEDVLRAMYNRGAAKGKGY